MEVKAKDAVGLILATSRTHITLIPLLSTVAVAFKMNFSNIFTDSYILIQDYIDESIFLPGCANYSSDAARKFTYRYILTVSPSWGILGRTLAASKKDAFSR